MKVNKDPQLIQQFLTRGVENVYPSANFVEARLNEGKSLTMYYGIDPTGPTLHLGHAIQLRKLRTFQELGHKVILLIGDFTGMIGDPTDKSAARKSLSHKEVLQNAKLYKKQASKFLNFSGKNPAQLKYNSKWLAKMALRDVIILGSHFTVQQLLERDMFKRRLEEQKPIYVHEFLYPLMQGYDCVAMKVDGEMGGNDQTFNMLAGRTLMKEMLHKEKFVLATKLLVDPTGKKMGKTEGNMITLMDSADEMFGKVMSWTDGMIVPGYELLTDEPLDEIEKQLKNQNPRDIKMGLAIEIVEQFFGEKIAIEAQNNFISTFRQGIVPLDVPEFAIQGHTLLDVIVETGLVSSKSEGRRVFAEGGVKVDGVVVRDHDFLAQKGQIIQKGKRHFVKTI